MFLTRIFELLRWNQRYSDENSKIRKIATVLRGLITQVNGRIPDAENIKISLKLKSVTVPIVMGQCPKHGETNTNDRNEMLKRILN